MNRIRKILVIIAIVAAVMTVAALIAFSYIDSRYEYESVRVNIPAGLSKAEVADLIRNSDLGKSFGSKVANIWNASNPDPEKAHGSYLVEQGDRVLDVAKRIASGRQTPVRFTFNNLRRFSDLASRAAGIMEFDSATFMAAADSILKPRGFVPETYSASVLPDTYEFYWTATPEKVINTLAEHRDRFWNQERRDKAAKEGLTPEEVHTLASIVEEESNKADERPVIARLYMNRLARHMPLQADPTVKYAFGDFTLKRIGREQIMYDSPYNTYMYQGLPPGPIRIVEGSTVDAVLGAPENDYLYMCAKSDFSGRHDFTDNYARHRINAASYHRALTARGIQ